MKNRFTKILGVVLTLAVLASMLVVSTPASAGYNAWSVSTSPDALLVTTDIVANFDVLELVAASNGTNGYAVGSDGLVYKTVDGGKAWAAVTGWVVGTNGAAKKIALAPDVADGAFVAVATDNTVWISGNGGTAFFQQTTPAVAAINDIAISNAPSGARAVAVAGNMGGAAVVAYYTISTDPLIPSTTWVNALGGGTWGTANVTGTPVDALAVEFSANYNSDHTMVVILRQATGAPTINLANTVLFDWNGDYNVWAAAGWASGKEVGAAASLYASLELGPGYLAYDGGTRVAYVGLSTGLYRMSDIAGTQLAAAAINSVALNTAGDKLVAGATTSNTVFRLASPASALPLTAIPSGTYKSPGYVANALGTSVDFFGATVGAATAGGAAADNSAFALSADDGKSFNDVSFIDTVITTVDLEVNADGSKMYLATDDGVVSSLWRKTTSWERVFKMNTANVFFVEPAADNFDVVYFAEAGGNTIYYSNDAGQTTWNPTSTPPAMTITDIVVESIGKMYILTGAQVAKSTDGFNFLGINTNAGTGNDLYMLSAGNLIVAGSLGVAYSVDSGATFTAVASAVGAMTVATADKLTTGGVITAATATNVYQYTIGTSVAFAPIVTGAAVITGTPTSAVVNSGVTYVLTTTETLRSPVSNFPVWKVTADAAAVIPHIDIEGSTGGLFCLTQTSVLAFSDVFVAAGPAVVAPADNFIVPINQETGNANNVVFQWTGITNAPLGTTYNVQIALDSAFTQVVFGAAGAGTGIAGAMTIVGPSGTLLFPWQSDTTYYWRVRADAAFDSPWSTVRKFKIDTLAPVALVSPTNGTVDVSLTPTFSWSPAAGATGYELVVSDDPTFAIITYSRTSTNAVFYSDEELAYSTVYYWKVRPTGTAYPAAGTPYVMGIFTTMAKPTETQAPITITNTQPTWTVEVPDTQPVIPSYLLWIIIAIGAILVIALIVLIVRTRRVS